MRYADPLAQAEIDRLTAKLAVLEAGQPLVSEALRDEIQRLTAKLERVAALDEEFLDLRDRGDRWGKYRDIQPHHWMTKGPHAFEECARRLRYALADPEETE